MKRYLVFTLLAVVACESSTAPPEDPPDPVPADPLSQVALMEHLNVLAADSLYGRQAGSTYELMAAEYVRDEFIEYDLDPGTAGWLQTFQVIAPGTTSQNVLGVLPGQGSLANQWVIVGAHYDHVGIGPPELPDPDTVYNGADDNASGTVLMMEIARYMSDHVAGHNMGDADRRSIMFQAYGSEEIGLVGSEYFCDNPTVPMGDIVAMLNLDMVGRLSDNGLILIGVTSSSDWLPLIAEVNEDSLDFGINESLMRRSDQACFYDNAKPVLFLHTGLHSQYHMPSDEVSLIDEPGMITVGDLALALLLELAVRPTPLVFTPP
jgi:Zn-dependent M28 family amino/carboxypeptidase